MAGPRRPERGEAARRHDSRRVPTTGNKQDKSSGRRDRDTDRSRVYIQRKKEKYINNNGEFDPGSGCTLATGLTHASRGAAGSGNTLPATGARVSNAYATCPLQGDNREKSRLIPHIPKFRMGFRGKANGKGWACVALGSWRGNGPPIRRCLGVLRGRSPTLVLRHGPDSYGRQQ